MSNSAKYVDPAFQGVGQNVGTEIWQIEDFQPVPLPKSDNGKFYSGDSYIILQDDQLMVTRLANTMWSSLKGRPVQGRIFQGREPPHFIALVQPMGGISSGYKKFIADKNLNDGTHTSDGIALIQVSGTSAHNNKAVQVDTPGVALKHVNKGTENCAFWFALGGKQSFTSKKITQDIVKDPHLYTFSFKKGKLEVTEVFNYSQDYLLTKDMLVLDTHAEIFIWIGQSVDSKEKQKAFHIGQKYIDLAVSLEGLSPHVPLYKITAGNEPSFFTAYFSWDNAKSMVQGNSFQKKLLHLFGTAMHASESKHNSNSDRRGGPTQRASALAALSSAFKPSSNAKTSAPKPSRSNQGSRRAAAVAALSSVLTAEQKKGESETSTTRFSRSPSPGPHVTVNDSAKIESAGSELGDPFEVSAETEITEADSSVSESNGATVSYDRLKAKSINPFRGIDYKQREAYLSEAEFQKVLDMTKEAFYRQPK